MAARFRPYAANSSHVIASSADIIANSTNEDHSVGNEKLTRKAHREKVRREKRQNCIYKMKEVLEENEQISFGSKLDILNVLELTLQHIRDLEAEVQRLNYEKASRVTAMRGENRAILPKGSNVNKESSGCTSTVPNMTPTATLSPTVKLSGVSTVSHVVTPCPTSQSPATSSIFPLMGANDLATPGHITPQMYMNYMNFMMQCSMANLQTFGGLNLPAMSSGGPCNSMGQSKGQSSKGQPLHTPQGNPLRFS